jgi:uncharacterized phage protein (TIGR01671 family)
MKLTYKPEFRAWYLPDGKTEDGFIKFEQDIIEGNLRFYDKSSDWLNYDFSIPWEDPDNWILEEFTGLLDINGVKIFVGDVIKAVYYPAKMGYYESIIMKDQLNGYCFVPNQKLTDFETTLHKNGHYEVIGNIWQNGNNR